MEKTKLIEYLQKAKGNNVYIAIPFENGHAEYDDNFLIEETGEDIAITTKEIK